MHTRPLRKFGEPCKVVYPIEQCDNKLSTNNVANGYYIVRADKQNFLHPSTQIPNADLILRRHDGRLCIADDVRLDSEVVWKRRQRVLARDLPSSATNTSTAQQPAQAETRTIVPHLVRARRPAGAPLNSLQNLTSSATIRKAQSHALFLGFTHYGTSLCQLRTGPLSQAGKQQTVILPPNVRHIHRSHLAIRYSSTDKDPLSAALRHADTVAEYRNITSRELRPAAAFRRFVSDIHKGNVRFPTRPMLDLVITITTKKHRIPKRLDLQVFGPPDLSDPTNSERQYAKQLAKYARAINLSTDV